MITTHRNIPRYQFTCDECGKLIEFASSQPRGDTANVICECFASYTVNIVPDSNERGLYRMQEKTRRIRKGIIGIFQRIGRVMTVRQVFYQAIYAGLVPKKESGYNLIQRQCLVMRRLGLLPYPFISDLTRRRIKPTSYTGLEKALDRMMTYYRQDVWANQPDHVEIWLEKDALAGIFAEITEKWDVPLFPARGFSSESFLYSTAEEIRRIGKPTYVYYFSDYDDAGQEMCDQVEKNLPQFDVDINFIRAALTPEQIDYYGLPNRPTKAVKTREKKDGTPRKPKARKIDNPTELDAMQPEDLHDLIEGCILNHISRRDLDNVRMEEKVQKDTLSMIMDNFRLA